MPPVAKPQRSTRVADVRVGDEVLVLAGKDKGSKGTVTKVITNLQGWKRSIDRYGTGWQKASPLAGAAVVVDGLNIAKRHTKPRTRAGATERQPRIQQGGILDLAMPMAMSKVQVVCPACSKPTRVGRKQVTDSATGRKHMMRVCRKCEEMF